MQSSTIGDALFTKTQRQVLALLFGFPDRSFYTNEIVRLANMGRGTISRELERFVAADLLLVSNEGNQRHYKANPNNPIYEELLGIIRKTFGMLDIIRSKLDGLDAKIEFAFVYGSIAKGGERASSDIDLMLIGKDLVYGDVLELLLPAEKKLGRTINPTIYTLAQIKRRLRDKNNFLTKVMQQPKLWVKGSEDDIKKLR